MSECELMYYELILIAVLDIIAIGITLYNGYLRKRLKELNHVNS